MITQWDWADPKAYLHDEISTDKRNPTRQRQRPDLRIARGEPRLSAGARSGAQHDQPGEDSVSRSGYARPAEAAQALGGLGRRSDLGQPHDRSQSDVRRARAPLVHRANPRGRQSRVLQGGIEPSFGEAHSAAALRPPAGNVRSDDQADRDDRHLLRHAPPAVRRGRQQHAVDQQRRWRRRGRLAEHEDVGPDARRAEVAGLDGAGARHQRQRQARRLRRRRAERGHRAERRKSGHFVRGEHAADPTKDTRLNAAFYGLGDRHRRDRSGAPCSASRAESCG